MMEKCFDEAVLQAFLDNELEQTLSQKVARHLVECDPCADLLAVVEEETALAFAALEQEFNTLVPTQRLWTKINESIEIQSRRRSLWQRFLTFVSGLSFTNPHVVAFGSLLLVVGVVSALVVVKNDNGVDTVAHQPPVSAPQIPSNNRAPINEPVADQSTNVGDTAPQIISKPASAPQYRIEKAVYIEPSRRTPVKNPPVVDVRPQYLDGEESYVTTIARLETTVNEKKDEVLTPSARFSYEKDMAIVTSTIKKMRKEVKKNPKNADARRILFASYQNQIELLNSVTQRSELMASLRD